MAYRPYSQALCHRAAALPLSPGAYGTAALCLRSPQSPRGWASPPSPPPRLPAACSHPVRSAICGSAEPPKSPAAFEIELLKTKSSGLSSAESLRRSSIIWPKLMSWFSSEPNWRHMFYIPYCTIIRDVNRQPCLWRPGQGSYGLIVLGLRHLTRLHLMAFHRHAPSLGAAQGLKSRRGSSAGPCGRAPPPSRPATWRSPQRREPPRPPSQEKVN